MEEKSFYLQISEKSLVFDQSGVFRFFSSFFVHFELYRLINSSYRGKLLGLLSSVGLIFFLLKKINIFKKLKELKISLLHKQVGKNLRLE